MAVILPHDILHLICAELGHRRDFNSLFNITVSSKQLAQSALPSLYRIHNASPVVDGGSDEINATRLRVVQKWSRLWQTLLLSSIDKTLFPYSQYIRVLNLRDLSNLFDDRYFNLRELFDKESFGDDLRRFSLPQRTSTKNFTNRLQEKTLALDEIGEVVTQRTPLLETLSGDILSSSLSKWITRLPRLRSLELWMGDALKGAEELIYKHCPFFRSLSIYEWMSPETDSKLATFLMGLRPQTLESFEVISRADVSHESLLALSTHHQESLKELKLSGLHLTALPMLKDCVALESLHLDAKFTDHNLGEPVISDIVDWLRSNKKLQSISLVRVIHSPEIMKPILLENDVRLLKLELEGYIMANSKEFHQALANQTSLQSLKLKGDSDDTSGVDTDILVDALAKLANLRDLQLRDVSDFFSDADICRLVRDLDELQMFWTSGYGISDAVLPALVKPKLRSLSFGAMTVFTKDGILKYISSLDPEQNKGLVFSILNADPDSNLIEADQKEIRQLISNKVDGGFEFFLSRDIDSSDELDQESD